MPTLVVARYNEPLDWLSQVPKEWEVRIYNKGERVSPPASTDSRCLMIDVANIGREAETFLYHNMSEAPRDYTIYLQGNPFDHCPDPIGQANFIMRRGDRVGWLGPHYDTEWNVPPHTLADLGAIGVWARLFSGEPMPRRFSFPAGAQMVVWRDRILARSAEWWRRAHEIALTDDWRVAHCFERFWPSIYA